MICFTSDNNFNINNLFNNSVKFSFNISYLFILNKILDASTSSGAPSVAAG